MHASVQQDRNSWRLPPDETLQVADPKSKSEVGDEEEHGYDPDDGHNWRSIIFSLMVIGLVIAGIVTAIYLLGYVDELLYWSGRRMKLEEYLQGELDPHRLPPTWISPTHFVFQADDGGLALLDTSNDSVSILVTNHTLRQLNVKGYECSCDLRYVLFKHNVKSVIVCLANTLFGFPLPLNAGRQHTLPSVLQKYVRGKYENEKFKQVVAEFVMIPGTDGSKVFRQSFTAHYTVYDVSNDHHIPLRLHSATSVQQQRLQHASWLGNSTSLLIVADNDIYLRTSPTEVVDYRLTTTGALDAIYNGVPDWLYQEDVLSSPDALWDSTDGTHIMYATFDDSAVGNLTFPWFATSAVLTAGAASQRSTVFPAHRIIRYPTPGTTNPEVQLWIMDITNITDIQKWEVKPPKALQGQDYYLTSAGWIGQNNHQVSAVWMNRAQNLSIISACLYPNWTCVETHVERAPEDSWLDIQPHPLFSPDGDSFLMLAPIQEENAEHYTHIKHVTLTQQRISVLSHGRYEVTRILAWDTFNHLVYYLGSHERKPGQRHLYVVRDPTIDDPRRFEAECITCDLSGVLWSSRYYYSNCTHFSAAVNPRLYSNSHFMGASYYVLQCEGPGLPLAGVHSAETHRLLRILYDTRPQRTPRLRQLALPTQRSFEVPLAQGSKAQVQLLLPPSWREELRDAAYPVLVEVNGRPGSKSVTEEFRIDWGTYMSSHCDVVYVRLDVRGAKGQGTRTMYRHLGGVEVQDQIAVLKYLLDTMKFLDETRVGVWGWGYGGYVTAMVLGSQQRVFKCGIAVSPITDWLYYNSAFTERILGLPGDNYKGYVEADATQRARHIPSHSLYLMHGLADLTAPYQHSIALARALTDAGVIFRYQSYADEGHELVGVLEHVYKSMEDFLTECLSLDTDDPRPAETNS